VEPPFRILLVDDHATVRVGLKLLIDSQPDMKVVGEAANGKDAVRQTSLVDPDIVVMDISMPDMNGLVATRTLKQARPGVAVVALTRHEDDTYVEELLRAGASGYVLKQSAPDEFLRAVRAVAEGGIYVDSAKVSRVADGLFARDASAAARASESISDRETQVLRLVATGHSNKEIAAQLGLSVKTVEAHKANAMRKLGLKGRIDVIRYAVLQGWLYDT